MHIRISMGRSQGRKQYIDLDMLEKVLYPSEHIACIRCFRASHSTCGTVAESPSHSLLYCKVHLLPFIIKFLWLVVMNFLKFLGKSVRGLYADHIY